MWFISHGDFIFPFSAGLYWLKHLFVWSFQTGAANLDGIIRLPGRLPILVIFQFFGSQVAAYCYIALSLVVVFWAFYYFAGRFLGIKNRLTLVVGALLFTANPIFLGNLSKIGLVAAASMLPLCLALVKQGFELKKFSYFVVYIFALNFSLLHPFTFTLNVLISGVYLAAQLYRHWGFVRTHTRQFVFLAVAAVLLHAYFILPTISLGTVSKTALSQDIAEKPVDYTRLVEIANADTIFTALSLSKNVLKDFEFYIPGFQAVYFVAIFALYTLLLGLLVYVHKRLRRGDMAQLLLYMAAFLVLILLSTATFLHVDDLIKFLIGLPGGWMFRSPLKWQLYIPFVLFSALLVLMGYVRDKRLLRACNGMLLLVLLGGSGVLGAEIASKLLAPRHVDQFAQLQQVAMEQKTMLFIGTSDCTEYARENGQALTELNQVLISKQVQIKRIEAAQLSTVNISDYDFALACQFTPSQGVNNQLQQFRLRGSFADHAFDLYENTQAKPSAFAFGHVYALDSRRGITQKNDFTQNVLGQPLYFTDEQQYRDHATGLNNIFESIAPRQVGPGSLVTTVVPNGAGEQQLFVRKTPQQLYAQVDGASVTFSPQHFLGAKPLDYQGEFAQLSTTTPEDVPLTVTYKDQSQTGENKFSNPSFDAGLWQQRPGDCNNYDTHPELSMQLIDDKKTLELFSARHTACTGPEVIEVKPGSSYLLSFDYQAARPDQAGFFSAFDDASEDTYISERLPASGDDWHTASRVLHVPNEARKLTLLVYAFPDELTGTSAKVRYDNFSLIEIPDVEERFYALHSTGEQTRLPVQVNYKLINPTKKIITITGATAPFYLALHDSFSPQWRLGLASDGLLAALPWAGGRIVAESQHFKLNNFMNGWHVDPIELCKTAAAACSRGSDGSYDIELVAEFTPQRWFNAGGLISSVMLVVCLGYMVYEWRGRSSNDKK